jgi:hypothetical protein
MKAKPTESRAGVASAAPCSPSEGDKTSDIICMARLQLQDLIEELGSASGLLREAYSDNENGNVGGAEMRCEDVVGIMATIASNALRIGADLHKWADY